MITLAWPWLLLVAPLPWLLRRILPPAKRADVGLRVPFFAQLATLPANDGEPERKSIRIVYYAIWLLLVIAAARPQWLGEATSLPLSGRDMLLAIDLSGSMEMPDFTHDGKPATRLDVVKTTAAEFIAARVGDRIGLLLFGSRAYLQAPLTFDRDTVSAMLGDATLGLAGKETAIGDAIGLAVLRLRELTNQRVLILITDGANTAGEVAPLKAADIAAQEHVRIYTIGVGADEMRVNNPARGVTQTVNPSRDLDEDTLKRIAELTHGRYFRAKDTAGLQAIYAEIDELEPHTTDDAVFRPKTELYVWPLGAALLLSMLAVVPRPRLWRWHSAGNNSRG